MELNENEIIIPVTEPKKDKKRKGFKLKSRILMTVPLALAIPLMVLVSASIELYAGNIGEFNFALTDFVFPILKTAGIVFVLVCGILIPLRKKAFDIAYMLFAALALMLFLQGTFLNFGMDSLVNDGVGSTASAVSEYVWTAVNAVIWSLVCTISVCVGIFLPVKRKTIKFAGVILSCFLIIISIASLSFVYFTTEAFVPPDKRKDALEKEADEEDDTLYILSSEHISELSEKGNVVYFVIDRFDVSFCQDLVEADPDYFADLDGFTYYDNHVSLYARTFPAVPYMLSNIENDYSLSREDYFSKAYSESPFLADLSNSGYSVNIYTDSYYGYEDAKQLIGIADNVKSTDGSHVEDKKGLAKTVMEVCLYRYLPTSFKCFASGVSTGSFKRFIVYHSDYSEYMTPNQDVFKLVKGDKTDISDRFDDKKKFTFIHVAGCHLPCEFDENCKELEETHNDGVVALKGSFTLIREYLDGMRRAGVYDDATIIITGDHPRARSDSDTPEQPRITALFVKPKGSHGKPLEFSSAPIAQKDILPTIIKSEGIETEHDYGEAIFDIGEDSDRKRYHYFQRSSGGKHEYVVFEIAGNANDFSNWRLKDEIDVGNFYD